MSKRDWTKARNDRLVSLNRTHPDIKDYDPKTHIWLSEDDYNGMTVAMIWEKDPEYLLRAASERGLGPNGYNYLRREITSVIELAIMTESAEFWRRLRALAKVRPDEDILVLANAVIKGLGLKSVLIGYEWVPSDLKKPEAS